MQKNKSNKVSIVMGSQSDFKTMVFCKKILRKLDIEHEVKIICISSPILSAKGRVIGGLSITSSIDIHSLESLQEFKPQLLKTSELIGKEAGAWNFPEQNN